ncbi:MAG: hypothetical protein L3J18_07885 [Candidatus Brocadia sp.]|uniref:Uncharacterized protein n=1 Tax=Candidatus Brocadia fulgida TaxID=380242 RepID=A0A0M2UYE6_9BACT|nr:MAG: hypothetical protein BROFUL_01781 [Candidatus Brocadia fulgida]UJS22221.1 MAG: hypothetical protein L3J18_07885 [Candidatus Brocadia sp.]
MNSMSLSRNSWYDTVGRVDEACPELAKGEVNRSIEFTVKSSVGKNV